MSHSIENDFAQLFRFLEAQDQEVLLYAEGDAEKEKAAIRRFLSGDCKSDKDREDFFAMIRDNPRLISELAEEIKKADTGEGD